jgi:carboxymethylenebutenolidase
MPDDTPISADAVGLSTMMPPLGRRGFMTAAAAAAAGYTMAAGPIQAQSIVTTDTAGLTAGMVTIKVKGDMTDMPAYRAKPANVANPPVILVAMEIFGLHEYIKDVCRRLAKAGALAVAPDYYFRQGDLTKATGGMPQILPIVNAKSDAEMFADLDATVAWAKADGGNTDRLGITGFCRGGRTSWMYSSHNPNVKAAVPFYGPVVGAKNPVTPEQASDVVPKIRAAVLGLYGGADAGIPNNTVEQIRDAMKAAGKTVEIVIYPDAPHGFHADYRPSYRKDTAEDAQRRMIAWFRQHGVLSATGA